MAAVLTWGVLWNTFGNNDNKPQNTTPQSRTQVPTYTDASLISSQGGYVPYTEDNLALAAGKDKVIFFNAKWCPTCQVAKKNFEQNSDKFPENLVLFDADYDDFSELRAGYGVNVQHTFVQIDDSGMLVNRWSGSYIVDQITSNLL